MIKFWTDQASCKFQPTLICRICSGSSALLSSQGLSFPPPTLIHTERGTEWSKTPAQGMRGKGKKRKEENNLWLMQRPKEIAFCELQGAAVRVEPCWQCVCPRALPPSLGALPGLRDVQPWQVSHPFICMLAALRWLGKQKTCNCFGNLNNISSLETPGEKSLSGWQAELAWW